MNIHEHIVDFYIIWKVVNIHQFFFIKFLFYLSKSKLIPSIVAGLVFIGSKNSANSLFL